MHSWTYAELIVIREVNLSQFNLLHCVVLRLAGPGYSGSGVMQQAYGYNSTMAGYGGAYNLAAGTWHDMKRLSLQVSLATSDALRVTFVLSSQDTEEPRVVFNKGDPKEYLLEVVRLTRCRKNHENIIEIISRVLHCVSSTLFCAVMIFMVNSEQSCRVTLFMLDSLI